MLRIIEPPTADPVTLDEAKAHLRIGYPDDDALITGLIAAATTIAQNKVQRRFVTQTVEWVTTHWHNGDIRLPIAPVRVADANLSIKYIDFSTGLEATLDPSLYVLQTRGQSVRIIPAFGVIWPLVQYHSSEPIVIRFGVGDDVEDVPANVKAAIKLIVGHLYENRENVIVDATRGVAIELPQGAEAMLLSEVWE